MVENGISGFLVPVKSVKGLSDRLKPLVGDEALRARFGAQARAIAALDFSTTNVIEATFAVYTSLAGAPLRR